MPDLIFAATATTFSRARLGPDHVLFQVVRGTVKHGEVLAELCVDYTTLGVILGLVERCQPTTDPVLTKLLLAQENDTHLAKLGRRDDEMPAGTVNTSSDGYPTDGSCRCIACDRARAYGYPEEPY